MTQQLLRLGFLGLTHHPNQMVRLSWPVGFRYTSLWHLKNNWYCYKSTPLKATVHLLWKQTSAGLPCPWIFLFSRQIKATDESINMIPAYGTETLQLYLFTGLKVANQRHIVNKHNTSDLLFIKAVSPNTLSTAFRAVLFPDTGWPINTGMPQPSNLSITKSKLAERALTACAIKTWGKLFPNKLFSLLKSAANASPQSNSVIL